VSGTRKVSTSNTEYLDSRLRGFLVVSPEKSWENVSWQVKIDSLVCWDCKLPAGRSQVRFTDVIAFFFNLPNPSSHTIALGSNLLLTEMSTRNRPRDKRWAVLFMGLKWLSMGKCERVPACLPHVKKANAKELREIQTVESNV
jgi:hypothetical protein